MMDDQKPSTSQSPNDKEGDLARAQRTFEGQTQTAELTSSITVRRRRRGLRFVAQDLLFVIKFEESDAGELPILNVLMGIHSTILTLIRKLKNYFNDKKRRLCFFSATMDEMTSPMFSGGRDLWNESQKEICNSILKPLFAYLCSNAEISLSSGLELKACILSLAHTQDYDQRRNKRATKRPPPEDHLVGHGGSSLKSIDNYSGRNFGLILIPKGIPADETIFDSRCLPVAFCIGKMINDASFRGEASVKKLLFDLRGLSQRANASKKHKNAIGYLIWEETKKMLDEICTTPNGPHSYSCLDALTRKYDCQAVVFSPLLAQPLYTFPSNIAETQPDKPVIFLQEVVTLDPQAKTQWHVNTVVSPHQVFKGKFFCVLCYQTIGYQRTHSYCPVRKRCYLCSRVKLDEKDWYGHLMSKKYCPSNLIDHPAVTYLTDQSCPTCNEKVTVQCCLKIHQRNCSGRTRCKKCYQLIIARRGENLNDKVKAHVCGLRKCLSCFEDINIEEIKSHCCRMAQVVFPKFYNRVSLTRV